MNARALTAFACAIAALASLGSVPAAAGERLDNIVKNNTLRVGTPGDYRPFAMKEDSGYAGHDIDVVKAMAEVYGWKVEFVPTTWKQMAADLKDNRFDVAVGGITRSPARALTADFLPAYELDDKTRGTTVNPGLIHGGTGANIISDHAEVTLDLRFWNDEDGRELISKIRALAEKTWVEGVTQTVEQLSYSPAMPLSENTRALVEKITDAASEAGFDARWVDAGGASDGNHMAEAGIPVVDGCGPAGGGFHSEREFLRLETVEERINMIVNLLKRL